MRNHKKIYKIFSFLIFVYKQNEKMIKFLKNLFKIQNKIKF